MIRLEQWRQVGLIAQRESSPLTHLGAEQEIDWKKVHPHEQVRPIGLEIHAPAKDG